MIAGLNLKAGRLSIALSDYTTAFTLFEYGISYLGDDKWTSQYELSIDLFDSVAEAACALNKRSVVKSRVEEVVAHAKCFDDSLNCKYLLMLGRSCDIMLLVFYTMNLTTKSTLQLSFTSEYRLVHRCQISSKCKQIARINGIYTRDTNQAWRGGSSTHGRKYIDDRY